MYLYCFQCVALLNTNKMENDFVDNNFLVVGVYMLDFEIEGVAPWLGL